MISLHKYRPSWPTAAACVLLGASALADSLFALRAAQLDLRLLLIAFLALSLGNAAYFKVPRARAYVAASDALVLLAFLHCGHTVAVPLAALAALLSSFRFAPRAGGPLLVASLAAAATYAPSLASTQLSLPTPDAARPETLPAILLLLALARSSADSLLASLAEARGGVTAARRSFARILTGSFVAYAAAAAAAGVAYALTAWVGFEATLAALAAAGVAYLTRQNYAGRVGASAVSHAASRQVSFMAEGEETLRRAFEHAQIGTALVSARGRWLRVNRSLCEFLGRDEAELLATDLQSVTHADDLGQALAGIKDLLRGRTEGLEAEVRHLHKTGRTVWARWSVGVFRTQGSEEPRLILQAQDVTERKLSEERLLHDAFHDALTGLPNRALFIDHVKLTLSRARRQVGQRTFAVLFLDLDRFKVVNDSLGHLAGDQLLVGVARRLETCLREGDTVARVGGDEFTILLDDLQDQEEAVNVAERIQRAVSAPFQFDGHEVFTTVSIGVAPGTVEYLDPEDILRDADTAMYRAKAQGKARHEVFDKTMHAFAVNLLQIETDLRKALDREQFVVLYQPIVALDDFRLCGFEALVRWQHPERGLISPLDFIPIAEDTGQIVAIGEWALREACRQMSAWHRRFSLGFPFFISVNLSSRQFTEQKLIRQVGDILADTGLNPRNLKLEITESAVMENIDKTTQMLRQLRGLGVQLSIDDFGTGYSSLSYLHRFPIDTLKIDRSFVTRMVDNPENIEIVRTIMMLAQTLGMDVVAEGVETKEQLVLLRQLRCEYGQGYYFSRPVAAADAERIISETCAPDYTSGGGAGVVTDDRAKPARPLALPAT